jgi:hypothetical protein
MSRRIFRIMDVPERYDPFFYLRAERFLKEMEKHDVRFDVGNTNALKGMVDEWNGGKVQAGGRRWVTDGAKGYSTTNLAKSLRYLVGRAGTYVKKHKGVHERESVGMNLERIPGETRELPLGSSSPKEPMRQNPMTRQQRVAAAVREYQRRQK